MVKIKTDIPKNRLYVSMTGILTLEDAMQAQKIIHSQISSLKPGFDVINDLSKFIRGDDTAGKVLKEIIVMLVQNDVNRVVRVVGTSKTGLLQFANNTLQLKQYNISYVPTLEEAEDILNN